MALVAGSVDGVWRIDGTDHDGDRMLSAGAGPLTTWRVKRLGGDLYAATEAGLFRSADGGFSWTDLSVPTTPVFSVCVGPEGRVYAGTHPPRVYASTQQGWTECDGLQDQPSRSQWDSPVHDEGQVRHLDIPQGQPERVVAGVERGGVHLSEDRGETWRERRAGVWDDIHHLHRVDPCTYYASTGTGLYRTADAGHSWTRLDDDLERSYFREAIVHDGTLFAGATMGPSTTWTGPDGADAALYESENRGGTFRSVSYPGEGFEAVLAWAADGSRVYAGTDRGRVIVREDDEWKTWARIPAGIRSLAIAESA